jgi:hypothetical protein
LLGNLIEPGTFFFYLLKRCVNLRRWQVNLAAVLGGVLFYSIERIEA